MFLLTYETSCFLMRFCFIIPGSFLLSNFFPPSLGKFPYHLVQVSFQPTHRPWHFRLDEPSQVRAVSSAPDNRNLFMNACRWALLMQVLLQMCKESGRHQVCWGMTRGAGVSREHPRRDPPPSCDNDWWVSWQPANAKHPIPTFKGFFVVGFGIF